MPVMTSFEGSVMEPDEIVSTSFVADAVLVAAVFQVS